MHHSNSSPVINLGIKISADNVIFSAQAKCNDYERSNECQMQNFCHKPQFGKGVRSMRYGIGVEKSDDD